MTNQTREDLLFESIEKSLQSLDNHYTQAYIISTVPAGLKKSTHDDAYIPRVVTMGPRIEMQSMEEIKLRCMLSLLHRTGEGKADASLRKCCKTILDSYEKIRASYVNGIFFNMHLQLKANQAMLVDCCFLLELLITKGFNSREPSHYDASPPAPQVLQNDDVLSDLILFENQIPFFLIHDLSETLFPHSFGDDSNRVTVFNNLALSILGYSHLPQGQGLEIGRPTHLLDLVHSFVNIKMYGTQTQHVNAMMCLKLNRCATQLQVAAVSIQLAQDKGMKCLDFEFKFKKGKLEIAALHITKTTEAKWRNVIAWEHHKMNLIRSCSNQGTVGNQSSSSSGGTCGKFTFAALIFNDLIRGEDDVKLLKKKNIIVNHTEMSDKELVDFFSRPSFGVDRAVVDYGYNKMVNELNNYSSLFSVIQIWKAWFINFMRQDYNFVATVVSLCTVVQTVYAIVAYQLPK